MKRTLFGLLTAWAALAVAPAAGVAAPPTFAPAVNYPADDRTRDVTVGDIDGNGSPDIVTANTQGDNVSVLLNNGDGTFAPAKNAATGPGSWPQAVAIGDLNRDGRADLVVAKWGTSSNPNSVLSGVAVLLGTGGGDFAPAQQHRMTYATDIINVHTEHVAVADLDGDGDGDIAAVNAGATTQGDVSTVGVRLSDGAGGLGALGEINVPQYPSDLDTGDLNEDGRVDLVTNGGNFGVVTVLRGNGNGSFAPFATFGTGAPVSDVTVGDVDVNGDQDVLVGNNNPGHVKLLRGNGTGALVSMATLTSPVATGGTAFGDLNGDGLPEVAFTGEDLSDEVRVLVANGPGIFNPVPLEFPTSFNSIDVAVADLNGDGRRDLAVANFFGNSVSVLLNSTDTTPPDTTITVAPAERSSDTTATFEFTSSEAGTFECSLDGEDYETCTTPYTTGELEDGRHEFHVRARDLAGNTDPTRAEHVFHVDTTAPDSVIDTGPAEGSVTSSDDVTFTYHAEPAADLAGFECRMDGEDFASCDAERSYTGLTDGEHTFQVRATDTSGNVESSPAVRRFTVDTTPPDTTITDGPAALTNDTQPTFTFTSTEGDAFACTLDGEDVDCASPYTTPALGDGEHTFAVAGIDAVGNADPSPAERTFTVDATPPQTTITAGPDGPTTDATPTFEFTSSETPSTFECRIDAGDWQPCGTPFTTPELTDGEQGAHTFAVRATDAAGNTDPTAATRSFLVTARTRLTADPATVRIADFLRIRLTPRATLTVARTGAPLAGRTIVFTAGGKPVCTATTSAQGVAACQGLLPVLSTVLSLGYDASFGGEPKYAPASAHGALIAI